MIPFSSAIRIGITIVILTLLNLALLAPRRGYWGAEDNRGIARDSRENTPKPSSPLQPPLMQKDPARESEASSSRKRGEKPRLAVRSKIAVVEDADTSQVLLAKKADEVVPIASITKLMTAMVVLDANLPFSEMLTISKADRDLVKGSYSRLRPGWSLSREDLLHLALMASENRAASALSRYYPGGQPAFIAAMNAKAAKLGMTSTHFVSPNGLTSENVSSAFDLVKLAKAAYEYPLIREFSTDRKHTVRIGRRTLHFVNSNRLIGRPDWDIELQKTGFINESGDCLLMWATVQGRSLIMVFLDAYGRLTRFADARRVRRQLGLTQDK
jgi:D-alanyl-D-alanine endopeptidase (penicillin-binding protein 7)